MARIDDVTRIIAEDFPKESREVVDKLAFVLNNFMTQVVEAFNKNIDFDNLRQEIVQFETSVDSNGKPLSNNKIPTKLRPRGIIVIKANNVTKPAIYPESNPFISYTDGGLGILTINKISGLSANDKYSLTVLIIG